MNKTRLGKIKTYAYLALFFGITSVIFIFASFSGEVSGTQSNYFVDLIVTFLGWFNYQLDAETITSLSIIVRKLFGHFLIFFLDGIFAYLSAVSLLKFKRNWMLVILSLIVMVLIASISEIIQLFASGRAGTLIDVILDSAGATLGIFAIFWINQIYRKHKEIKT